MSEMIYEEQKQEALPELPVYEKIHKELMDLMENPMNEYYDLGFPAIPPEQSLADAYQKVMEKLEQSIHIAEEEEKADLEMMREYIKVSYERASKTLQETYGAELSEQFLQKTPGDALLNVPGVERSFLAEKEALLAQHKKWNPAYTMRTAKKLAEQWQEKEELSNALLSCDIHNFTSAELTAMAKESMERCEKEIAKALQKHAPDIQNLPSAALRQNAAARIAKSAAGSVRAGQKEQDKAAAR